MSRVIVVFSNPKRQLSRYASNGLYLVSGPAGIPEPLPARVDALKDDLKRVKAFLGMQDGATGTPEPAPGSDAAKTGAAAEAKGQWGAPGHAKGSGEGLANELDRVKQQLNDVSCEGRLGDLDVDLARLDFVCLWWGWFDSCTEGVEPGRPCLPCCIQAVRLDPR